MARGRGQSRPGNPDAVWSELDEVEQDVIARFAKTLGVPIGAWATTDELLSIVVPVARTRRIARLQAAGLTLTAAHQETAEAFGQTYAAIHAAHYRQNRRALGARVQAREDSCSSATDETAVAG